MKNALKARPSTVAPKADTETLPIIPAPKAENEALGRIGNATRASDMYKTEIASSAAEKSLAVSKAKQRLAEASDLAKSATATRGECDLLIAEAATVLYQARAKAIATNDPHGLTMSEISAALGDVYGFKVTQSTGKPSKTPAGDGEAIRKRVVRLIAAYEFVNSTGLMTDSSKESFFVDLDKNEVAAVLAQVDNGHKSPYSAYDEFTAMKAAMREKTERAFNAKMIAEIATSLASEDAAKKFIGHPELLAAYVALADIWNVLDIEIADAQAKARLAETLANQAANAAEIA